MQVQVLPVQGCCNTGCMIWPVGAPGARNSQESRSHSACTGLQSLHFRTLHLFVKSFDPRHYHVLSHVCACWTVHGISCSFYAVYWPPPDLDSKSHAMVVTAALAVEGAQNQQPPHSDACAARAFSYP